MFNTIAVKSAALALFLTSAVVTAAEAQTIPPDARRSGYCNGGLFTLSEGAARFHIALDDDSSEPGIFVVMRYINQIGTVVKTRTVNIGPGASATLEYRGSGLYRVQAETFESSINNNSSERRSVVCSQELLVSILGPGGEDIGRLIGPPVWVPWFRVEAQ